MIDMQRYSTHRVYPRDGHRFIKGFALNDDSITLKSLFYIFIFSGLSHICIEVH